MRIVSGKATDLEIENAAADIFDQLRIFDSPKDAGSAFALAHWKMISATFPPEYRAEALAAIRAHHKMMEEFVNEGWQ
jgi:hypothetical protein